MIQLHYYPGNASFIPHLLLEELGEKFELLYETAAICLHLADTHPQVNLAPALGTPERWVNEGNAAGAAEVKAHAETKIGALLDQMDAHFAAHGKDWFLGERYVALDAYAFMMCRWTRGFARPAVQRVFATEKLPAPYV